MLGGAGRKTGKRIGPMTTISPKKGNGTSEISATGGRLPKPIKENDKQRNVSWLRRRFWNFSWKWLLLSNVHPACLDQDV